MASLPLHSCFGIASLQASGRRLQNQPQDGDSTRLGADEETDSAPRAACPQVLGRMVAVMVQMVGESKDLWRARLYAKAAPLALFRIHLDPSPVGLSIGRHAIYLLTASITGKISSEHISPRMPRSCQPHRQSIAPRRGGAIFSLRPL